MKESQMEGLQDAIMQKLTEQDVIMFFEALPFKERVKLLLKMENNVISEHLQRKENENLNFEQEDYLLEESMEKYYNKKNGNHKK